MNRKFKALGLAAVAALAIVAVAASMAQASNPGKLMATSYPATLHGSQVEGENHVFTLTDNSNLTTECTTATFTGTQKEASSTSTVHPEYGKGGGRCSAFLGLTATITTDGCNYLFHIGNTITPGGNWDGTVDIECEAGKAITIVTGTCELRVDPQKGLSTVEGINMLEAKPAADVTVKTNVRNIHYTVTKDGFLCPLEGLGKEFVLGDYTGNTTITAEDTLGNAEALTIE
jgi:hypothetical protein